MFDDLTAASRAGYALVDVREFEELTSQPAPTDDVRHIPLQQLLYGPTQLEHERPHLLVCATGRRSLAAAQELRSRGFNRVYSLKGGLAGLIHAVPA